jgi:hypothetical protein
MSNSLFSRILGLAFFAGSTLFLNGCGGSSSSSGGGSIIPPTQLTAPTISVPTGTYTTAQTVTVTGAAGTTVHCTTDGSTPNANSPACPSTTLSTNGTTTFNAYVSESGNFTDSTVATSKVTISLPVPQTISLPAKLSMLLGGTIDLNSSIVTASSSCAPPAVTWKLQSTDSNTATVGNAVLASYASNATDWGTLSGGNAPTENNVGTYTLTGTCGSVVATSQLTVTAGVPTVTSTTPSIMKASGGNGVMTGTNFSANNSTSASQWQGTLVASSYGSCPTTKATQGGSTVWVSMTQTQWGFTSSGATLGSWNISVINNSTAIGTDGGSSCTPNVYTVTATGMVTIGTGDMVVSYNPENGQLNLIQSSSNAVVASFSLASRAGSILATKDAVYVPQAASGSIAKIDLASLTLSSIATPGFVPVSLAKDASDTVYVAATLAADSKHGALLRIANGLVTKVSSADGITSLAASGSRLFWNSDSTVGKASTVHVYDVNQAAEVSAFTISREADTVMPLSGGKFALAYQGGSKEASVLDLDSLKESGSVSLTAGILGFNGDYASLLDGTIGMINIAPDGLGNPKLEWSVYSKQSVEDLYDGFAVISANGRDTLYVNHRIAQGILLPQARTVPNQQ